jgi:hypothetical protein
MATQARVTSVDVLEAFRSSLIVFLTKARESVDHTTDAVRKMRQWLEHDQRTHWESQIRIRQRKLDQAEAELFSAKLSSFRDSISRQQMMVRRAREAMAEAQEKLRNVKKWHRDFDSVMDPLTKRLNPLRDFLDQDLQNAVAFLSQAQSILLAYAETRLTEPAPPTSTEAPQ